MGLKKARETMPKREQRPPVSLTVGEAPLAFREPRSSDMTASDDRLKKVRTNAPLLSDGERRLVILLSNCYRSEPEDNGLDFDIEFAGMATDNDLLFDSLIEQFSAAFPEWADWLKAKAAAKNDSGGSAETPSESDSPSEDSPKN